jgi:hypothetical protein
MQTIKRLGFSLIMVLMAYGIQAQFTIQAGMNAASWRASIEGLTIETDSRVGFHIGGTYSTPVSDKFMFKPGLLYSQKGAKFGGFLDESLDIVQTYVEIPLTFVYQSNPEKGFFAEGGPYIGFLLSAESEGEDIKEAYNSTDFGLNLGLGYDFGKILIGLRGGLGITNIAKDDGDLQGGTVTNSNGQLYFAVKL